MKLPKVSPTTGKTLDNIYRGSTEGVTLNYIWEAFKLPGYGVPIPGLENVPVLDVPIGYDDVAQMGIGALVTVYGSQIAKKKDLMERGLGIITGVAITKGVESLVGKGWIYPPPPAARVPYPGMVSAPRPYVLPSTIDVEARPSVGQGRYTVTG